MVSATERVYQQVRRGILTGIYAPAARLRETQLANDLAVSRTPVREALRRLGAEGLVEIDTHRGAQVRSWTERDVDEIYSIRVKLESYAARLAAERSTEDQIARLRAIVAERDRLDDTDPDAKIKSAELAFQFHRQLLDMSGDLHLASIISGLVEMPVLHRAQLRYSKGRLDESAIEHTLIVQALAEHDAEWAEAIMRQHVLGARAEERRIFRTLAASSAEGAASRAPWETEAHG